MKKLPRLQPSFGIASREHSRRADAKFRAIFNTTLDGILIANDKGRYVAANTVASDLFGMERKSIVGRLVEDFADPERKHEVRANWRRFLKQGYQRGLFRIYRPDGSSRYVDYIARATSSPTKTSAFCKTSPSEIRPNGPCASGKTDCGRKSLNAKRSNAPFERPKRRPRPPRAPNRNLLPILATRYAPPLTVFWDPGAPAADRSFRRTEGIRGHHG